MQSIGVIAIPHFVILSPHQTPGKLRRRTQASIYIT